MTTSSNKVLAFEHDGGAGEILSPKCENKCAISGWLNKPV
jgi:hypothetical protein